MDSVLEDVVGKVVVRDGGIDAFVLLRKSSRPSQISAKIDQSINDGIGVLFSFTISTIFIFIYFCLLIVCREKRFIQRPIKQLPRHTQTYSSPDTCLNGPRVFHPELLPLRQLGPLTQHLCSL